MTQIISNTTSCYVLLNNLRYQCDTTSVSAPLYALPEPRLFQRQRLLGTFAVVIA